MFYAIFFSSISSVIPSSFLLSYHILSSERLTLSLRDSLSKLPHTPNIRDLESITLLQSLYAEALRYSVQIFVPRTSPVDYLQLGDAFIPPDKLVMVNTRVAHMDEKIWNSQGGKFPLDQLYPERFIVDPTDASTGPSLFKDTSVPKPEKPYFSMKGLEGSWIPYGGTPPLLFLPIFFFFFYASIPLDSFFYASHLLKSYASFILHYIFTLYPFPFICRTIRQRFLHYLYPI